MAAQVDKLAGGARSGPGPKADPVLTEPPPQPASASLASDPLEFRLLIEEDPAAPGLFIYKTINSATGEVVSQYPREQLVKLRENPAYEAGWVFKTSA